MLATLQDRLYRSEADALTSVAEEVRTSLAADGAARLDEQEVRQRTAVTQEMVDYSLGIPERLRQDSHDNLAKARAGEIPDVERVERLPTAIVEMGRLTEETIEAWPWPEGWWPAINQEMLKRSYEKEAFLTREEAARELIQGPPQ